MVLVRHGQSVWNKQNRFTGWYDAPLTACGVKEAQAVADALIAHNMTFDCVFTSYLQRAIRTLWTIQENMQLMWLPLTTDWRLNERHYGNLQGLNKIETIAKHGESQVYSWRRSYHTCPPPTETAPANDNDHRYAHVPVPQTESLADTLLRVTECYKEKILPQLQARRKVLIVAHGNSLRALVKYIENIPEEDIIHLEIPTGGALVYRVNDKGEPQGTATKLLK